MTLTERRLLLGMAKALLDTRRTILQDGMMIPLAEGPDEGQLRDMISAVESAGALIVNLVSEDKGTVKGRGNFYVCKWPEGVIKSDVLGKKVLIDGREQFVNALEHQDGLNAGDKVGVFVLAKGL